MFSLVLRGNTSGNQSQFSQKCNLKVSTMRHEISFFVPLLFFCEFISHNRLLVSHDKAEMELRSVLCSEVSLSS